MKKTKKIPYTPKYKFGGGFSGKDKQNVKDFVLKKYTEVSRENFILYL